MEKITSSKFFDAWLNVVTARKKYLLDIWQKKTIFTNYIKGDDNSVMKDVAQMLNLLSYESDYYSIDTILYLPKDRVPISKPNSYWFRNIRVAFEHENNFYDGLYKEVSHLLITNCDLRVLVTYPDDNIEAELNYLHQIISGNGQSQLISEEESFLIIFGYENGFIWEGFVYKIDSWKRINI